MSLFLTPKFCNFFERVYDRSSATLDVLRRFKTDVIAQSVPSSITNQIYVTQNGDQVLTALASQIKTKLVPILRDGDMEECRRVHRFNVWLLGVTKGIDLIPPRQLFAAAGNDDCDRCNAYHEEGGRLIESSFAVQTVLYQVLKCFNATPKLVDLMHGIKNAIDDARSTKKYLEKCEDGSETCSELSQDDGCSHQKDFEASMRRVELACRNFFTELSLSPFFTSHVNWFEVGLAPYIVDVRSVGNDDGVCVNRDPVEEAAEQERIAAQKRAAREARLEAERNNLKRRRKEIQDETQQLEKRLHQLHNENKKLDPVEPK